MIDRNYAPEGMIAVKFDSCGACKISQCSSEQITCHPNFRKDGETVRFARRPTVILNTTGKASKAPEWAKEARLIVKGGNEIRVLRWRSIESVSDCNACFFDTDTEQTHVIATEYR